MANRPRALIMKHRFAIAHAKKGKLGASMYNVSTKKTEASYVQESLTISRPNAKRR